MKNGSKTLDVSIAYIHGRLDQQVEAYAQDLGIPSNELASRLASLLHAEGQRTQHNVSALRSEMPGLGKAVAEMESNGDAHRQPQKRQKRSKPTGIKGYWAKMTVGQRSAEMNRRRLKGQDQKKAA